MNDTETLDVQVTSKNTKKPLTESELHAIWQQDEYHGVGGSYVADPFTGKRTPKED